MLDDFGVLRIQGPDTLRFLQGQLSNDMELLQPRQSLLAGLHNPQGRTVAVLRLFALAANDVLVVLPRDLAAPVLSRLRRYVLRAKLTLGDESPAWGVVGVRTPAPEAPAIASGVAACVDGSASRWMLVMPHPGIAGNIQLPAGTRALSRGEWRQADIAAGLPQVYAATSEAFVAQMLNLDCVSAVSFRKGCYTGQEIIARAHYRGRVKRRMQRFRVRAHAVPAPGDTGRLGDGRSFVVVDATPSGEAAIELLAVAPLTAAGNQDEGDAGDTRRQLVVLDAEALPLPYPLPD